jgi:hypothetical protein
MPAACLRGCGRERVQHRGVYLVRGTTRVDVACHLASHVDRYICSGHCLFPRLLTSPLLRAPQPHAGAVLERIELEHGGLRDPDASNWWDEAHRAFAEEPISARVKQKSPPPLSRRPPILLREPLQHAHITQCAPIDDVLRLGLGYGRCTVEQAWRSVRLSECSLPPRCPGRYLVDVSRVPPFIPPAHG